MVINPETTIFLFFLKKKPGNEVFIKFLMGKKYHLGTPPYICGCNINSMVALDRYEYLCIYVYNLIKGLRTGV